MLNWFARRMKEAQEKDETGQGGFTLIELLVVVIIIGILAAIAIPTFLAQRDRAQESAAESDLRNLSAAATAYASDNEGAYGFATGEVTATHELAAEYEFNATEGVTTEIITANADGYTAEATAENDTVFEFDSATGVVVEQ